MKEFNEFQNENFEKGVMVEKKPKHGFEEGPKHDIEKSPRHGFEEEPKHDIEKRPRHEVEEGPKHEVEKGPKHKVEEGPKHKVEEGPKHKVEEGPKHEGQGSIEERINFIINFSTDKTQLLELKKILVELEFYGKKEEKGIQDNDERKIRRR